MKVMKIMDNFEKFFSLRVTTMLVVMRQLRMGGYEDANRSNNSYDDRKYNREQYKPMFSVTDGEGKAVGHKKRKLRQLCDTDDNDDDNDAESHEVLEMLARKKNVKKKQQPAKVSAAKVGQGEKAAQDKEKKGSKRSSD